MQTQPNMSGNILTTKQTPVTTAQTPAATQPASSPIFTSYPVSQLPPAYFCQLASSPSLPGKIGKSEN
ncbi:hypothetical protein DSO57_1021442 [Entomophthora muscae]|uniref:Uncharacterized protein n=1 Tax=Entomophthora muscae TaxID=34485 RepID=A0ACC2SSK7_9FUNG|nr:hypothetical protein DSO57_1021442 [Entomophthora muscae]